jgi:hypothetical protein
VLRRKRGSAKMKDVANFVDFGKGTNQAESGCRKGSKKKFKTVKSSNKNSQKNPQKSKNGLVCNFCKSLKHMQKECAGFKEWLQ